MSAIGSTTFHQQTRGHRTSTNYDYDYDYNHPGNMAAASSSSRQDGGQRKSKKHKYPTTPLDDEAEECKCSDGKYYCPYQTNPKNPKKGKDSKPCGMSFTLPSDWR